MRCLAIPRDDALELIESEPQRRAHDAQGDRSPLRLGAAGGLSAPYTPAVAKPTGTKLIAENRRARRDYELIERVEAGVVLTGTEVKSARDGHVQLGQAYADIRDGEAWLIGASISEYAQGGPLGHQPDRDRKLLLHRGRDRLAVREGAGEGPHARSDADVLQGRPREGRDRARPRPRAGRQAARRRRARHAQREIERALKRRR